MAKSSRRESICEGVSDLALVGLAVSEPGFTLVRQGTLADALREAVRKEITDLLNEIDEIVIRILQARPANTLLDFLKQR
ncbi:hypothetical protein [Acidilobus sp.]|uniref:hypothetical protein n=1 Tax=Acidilobus sp. TaxID=1872109 RepID=UPI003D01291D